MKRSWIAIASVALVCAGLAVSAAAMQEPGGFFQQRAGVIFIHRVERELALTDAQRAQIKTILKTEEPNIEALAVRAHQEQDELRSAQSFDEAQVRSFAQQHESTTEDILVEREKIRVEIMQVLTPEQRQKAHAMREEGYRRFMERLSTIGDQL